MAVKSKTGTARVDHQPGPPKTSRWAALTLLTSRSLRSTVIGWLGAAIDARAVEKRGGEHTVEQLRSGLAGVLAAKRNPAIVPMPLPW
jgi:hypothetical protein